MSDDPQALSTDFPPECGTLTMTATEMVVRLKVVGTKINSIMKAVRKELIFNDKFIEADAG